MKSSKLGCMRCSALGLVVWLTLAACVSGSSDSVLPTNDGNSAPNSVSDDNGTDTGNAGQDDAPAPVVESQATSIQPTGGSLAITVTRVSDGDSIRADSAEGDLEVRLLGINAPEQDECFGSEAEAELARLLDGADVSIHPWPPERDDFGRELGFLVANGVFVNLSLVETGHVVARAQSDHGFDREFEEAEQNASAAGQGLWARDACGTPSDAELVIVEVFENAPGDDRQNPNGEYVVIENVGDNTVDLVDWAIRDESTRHRHIFGSIEISPGERVQLRTGCGDDDLGSDPIELFWCDPEPPVWNNGGDTAFLLDPNGAIADNFVVAG